MTKILGLMALLVSLAATAAAQKTSPTLTQARAAASTAASTATLAAEARVAQYGDLSRASFKPNPASVSAAGVRVGRVMLREEIPGGPWANGEIGDYLLENGAVRVIVKAEKRPGIRELPGAGAIADVVFRDQMWDSLGGIAVYARLGGQLYDTVYTGMEIKPPMEPIKTPFLVLYGHAEGRPHLQIITTLFLDPGLPQLNVSSLCLNGGTKAEQVTLIEEVQWGTLPVFVPAYGIPRPGQAMEFSARWVSGILDDYCLSEVLNSPAPLEIALQQGDMTNHQLASRRLEPGGAIKSERIFLLSRGDMAAVSEFALKTQGQPYGFIEGTVSQLSDKKPIANALVQIRRFNENYEEASGDYAFPPYALALTNAAGRYRIAVPAGPTSSYAIQAQTAGRILVPIQQNATLVESMGKMAEFNIQHTNEGLIPITVHDATTGEPMPAKLSFTPKTIRPVMLGAPWNAQGTRSAFYAKPGGNRVPLTRGKYTVTASRGPEYDIYTGEHNIDPDKPTPIRIDLKRSVPTPGMVSIDMNLPTDASPDSRTPARDLVLAAAGEGVEWIFSGDLNQATNLENAIRELKLEKWIKASTGVRLSYQYSKLFGEFYIFPVPAGTTAATLKGLAGPETGPADFFKAVRKAFPGAIISVMQPLRMNTSYLTYYTMDMKTGKSPFEQDFSLDFDAIEVFEGKATQANRQAWDTTLDLTRVNIVKLPLASSRSTNLYYEEPGYPRTYLVTGKDDARAMSDADAAAALREGRYFITNGPIIEQAVLSDPKVAQSVGAALAGNNKPHYAIQGGKVAVDGLDLKSNTISSLWPRRKMALESGEFLHLVKVSAAPWIRTNTLLYMETTRPLRQFFSRPTVNVVRFPTEEESTRRPYFWALHNPSEADKNVKVYRDEFIHLEVSGAAPLRPAVTRAPHGDYSAFAVTPPVVMDSGNDSKIAIR